jgi:hypothetical protein
LVMMGCCRQIQWKHATSKSGYRFSWNHCKDV